MAWLIVILAIVIVAGAAWFVFRLNREQRLYEEDIMESFALREQLSNAEFHRRTDLAMRALRQAQAADTAQPVAPRGPCNQAIEGASTHA